MATLYSGGKVFDGEKTIDGHAVLEEDGRIKRLAPAGEFVSFAGPRIDTSGGTLLPGLIDCHIHSLSGAEGNPGAVQDRMSAAQIAVLVGVISLRLAQFSRSPERGRALPATFRALLGLNAVILATQAANIAHYRAGWLCLAGLSLYAFFGFFVFVMLVAELRGGAPEAG